MVKKRLSKEYMELLRRNQNEASYNNLCHPCINSASTSPQSSPPVSLSSSLPVSETSPVSLQLSLNTSPGHSSSPPTVISRPYHIPSGTYGEQLTSRPVLCETDIEQNFTSESVLENENILEKENFSEEGIFKEDNTKELDFEAKYEASYHDIYDDIESIRSSINTPVMKVENNTDDEPICDNDIADEHETYNIKRLLQKSILEAKVKIKPPSTPSRTKRSMFVLGPDYQVKSSSHEKFMRFVKDERSKHKEIINTLSNTSHTLSRRPVKSTTSKFLEERRRKYPYPALRKSKTIVSLKSKKFLTKNEQKKDKNVHFGGLVTFEDKSSPVPIRPPRKKNLGKSQRKSNSWINLRHEKTAPKLILSRKTMMDVILEDDKEAQDETPEKPNRSYKDRDATPLSQALQPLVCNQYSFALGKVVQKIFESYSNHCLSR